VIEAIDRIVNRGGEADDVLRDVVSVLSKHYAWVGIYLAEGDDLVLGPSHGAVPGRDVRIPVVYAGRKVGELSVSDGDDRASLERVAVLISHYCLVAWDTGGEAWNP
jgi:putative methionine-R-sulfoxide reductase with GAF domain